MCTNIKWFVYGSVSVFDTTSDQSLEKIESMVMVKDCRTYSCSGCVIASEPYHRKSPVVQLSNTYRYVFKRKLTLIIDREAKPDGKTLTSSWDAELQHCHVLGSQEDAPGPFGPTERLIPEL